MQISYSSSGEMEFLDTLKLSRGHMGHPTFATQWIPRGARQ